MNYLFNWHPTAMVIKYLMKVSQEEPKFSIMYASPSQIGLYPLLGVLNPILVGFQQPQLPSTGCLDGVTLLQAPSYHR